MKKNLILLFFLLFSLNVSAQDISLYIRLSMNDCLTCQGVSYQIEKAALQMPAYMILHDEYKEEATDRFDNFKSFKNVKIKYDNILFDKFSNLPNSTYHYVAHDTIVIEEGFLKNFSFKHYEEQILPLVLYKSKMNKKILKDSITSNITVQNNIVIGFDKLSKPKRLYFQDSTMVLYANMNDSLLKAFYISHDAKKGFNDYENRKNHENMMAFPNDFAKIYIDYDTLYIMYNARYLKSTEFDKKTNSTNDVVSHKYSILKIHNGKVLNILPVINSEVNQLDYGIDNYGQFIVKGNQVYFTSYYKKKGNGNYFILKGVIKKDKIIVNKKSILENIKLPDYLKSIEEDISFISSYPYIIFTNKDIIIDLEKGTEFDLGIKKLDSDEKFIATHGSNYEIYYNSIYQLGSHIRLFFSIYVPDKPNKTFYFLEYDTENKSIIRKQKIATEYNNMSMSSYYTLCFVNNKGLFQTRYIPIRFVSSKK